MADARWSRVSRLVAERAGARGSPVSPGDACEIAAAVAGAAGGWLTVMSDPARRALVHATSARAAELEELQFMLGEGPCVDAFTSGTLMLVPDLGTAGWQARWPGFTVAGLNAGAAALFAFPLGLGAIRVGALGLYRETPGSLSLQGLADVLACAEVALQLLLSSRARTDGDGDGPGPAHDGDGRANDAWARDGRLDDHARVYQAMGMVSVQSGVGLEEALARLRAYAFAHDRALGEVAAAVVARRLRLDPGDGGGPAG